MIAVADTSAICYLIQIGEIDLLPKLFSQVLAPHAVRAELLHEAMRADIVLLDEKATRRIAAARGQQITGVLGILGEAATRGMVDLAPAIDRLRLTNFRASPALLKATLDRFGAQAP